VRFGGERFFVLDLIAFDADDTLWYTERLYLAAQGRFERLLAERYGLDGVGEALYRTEMRNLRRYGFGTKPFALSMIETAVQLTAGRIRGAEVGQILAWVHEMLDADLELLPNVSVTLAALARSHTLIVITKGDLHDQERKYARSGLGESFARLEVVSSKTEAVYRALLEGYGVAPDRFLMVGNSLRSDVLPVVAVGGHAAHIPAAVTWPHEEVDDPGPARGGYHRLTHMGELVGLVQRIEAGA
jgi:putative hydrolase of the HAD superfamily